MVTGILIALVILAICIAVGAGIIMLATRIVAGFTPKFLIAAITFVIEMIAGVAVSWGLNMALGAGGTSSVLALIIVFVVYSAILNAMVKRPGGAQMGFGKACLATLVQLIIEIVLGVVLFFVFGAAMFGMLGGAMMH